MQELTERARLKARASIAQQFADADKLDDLGVKSFELERQLVAAESQLNSAVQSKLDSLKRAVDLMDESALKLNKLSSKIVSIDDKIAQTNTAISNYSNLKRVHNARENLIKVISQVEFFARVPERVTYYSKKLEEHPECLKEVFLESLKLESLRAALLKEMRVSRDRRSSVSAAPTAGVAAASGSGGGAINSSSKAVVSFADPRAAATTAVAATSDGVDDDSAAGYHRLASTRAADGMYSSETFAKIREAVENHLHYVPELCKAVHDRIETNVSNMFEIAANTPADLVATFEVIEMQQEYNERRNKAGLYSNEEDNNNNSSNSSSSSHNTHNRGSPHSNYSADMQAKLRLQLDGIVNSEFNAVLEMNEDLDLQPQQRISPLTAFIMGANQILQRITEFSTDVVPCMPPSYEPLFMFIEAFDFVLLQKVDYFNKDLSKLKVSEMLDFINWIEYHSECMLRFGFPNQESIGQLNSVKTELMVEYQDRIKNQIMEWFDNIKKQEREIHQSTGGTLVTSNPEDMFNIIHAQLGVAREKLPPDYAIEVAIACLQVLQHVQRETYDTLSKSWRSMDPQYMCALINDNQRMREKCDEFGDHVVRSISDPKEKEAVKAMLDSVGREYGAIAAKAINSLTMCVLEDLDEPIFSKLYSAEWEQGEEVASVLVVTLQDYFSDLSEWLYDYFFRKLASGLLVSLIQRYVMFLRKKSNGVFTFQSQLMVTKRISEDREVLLEFFEKFFEDLGPMQKPAKYNYDDELESGSSNLSATLSSMEEFHVLLSFAKIVSAPYPSGVEGDIKFLLRKWGIDGFKAISAAIQCHPVLTKPEKATSIEMIKAWFDNGVAAGQFSAKPIEMYAEGFDQVQVNAAGNNRGGETSKPARVGFWGRKKT